MLVHQTRTCVDAEVLTQAHWSLNKLNTNVIHKKWCSNQQNNNHLSQKMVIFMSLSSEPQISHTNVSACH